MTYEKFISLGFSSAPRPFPGKYPTRVFIWGNTGPPQFSYIGKPVPELKNLVQHKYFKLGGNTNNLNFVEFDQNGRLLELYGGNITARAIFADLYFPVPIQLLERVGRLGRIFYYLDREISHDYARALYSGTFWRGRPFERMFIQMIRDCANARVNRNWFSIEAIDSLVELLSEKSLDWIAQPRVLRRPRPVETVETTAATPQAHRRTRPPRRLRVENVHNVVPPLTVPPPNVENVQMWPTPDAPFPDVIPEPEPLNQADVGAFNAWMNDREFHPVAGVQQGQNLGTALDMGPGQALQGAQQQLERARFTWNRPADWWAADDLQQHHHTHRLGDE